MADSVDPKSQPTPRFQTTRGYVRGENPRCSVAERCAASVHVPPSRPAKWRFPMLQGRCENQALWLASDVKCADGWNSARILGIL